MICPFRVHTKTHEYSEGYPKPDSYKETTCTYEPCHGDECPFYYVNDNDMPKCARCNTSEEEEIL